MTGSYGTTYKNDICINLSWSGIRNGEYEEYKEHTYPLSPIILRGVTKIDANGNIYHDGDRYLPDGTVERRWAERAYQSGDASDGSTMVTDGTTTVYKLTTPTTEQADPYDEIMLVDDWGTERFVDYAYESGDRDVEIPVGHETEYYPNQNNKLDHLPFLSDEGDGYYVILQVGTQMILVRFRIPQAPTTDGNYTLKATVSGGTPTIFWEVEE